MSDGSSGDDRAGQAQADQEPWPQDAQVERLEEAECLRLMSQCEVGRIAYSGRFGLTVLPVNYRLQDGTILFRTAQDSPMGEDLRTGIAHAEYQVAFEVDEIDPRAREGWSVLVHGSAHHIDTEAERAVAEAAGVEAWPGGEREHFIRITPTRISGRRIRQPGGQQAG